MKRGALGLLAVLTAAGLLVWGSAFSVGEAETVIVARFGDPRRVVDEPGLHFKLPPPLDTLIRVDRRVRVLDPDANEYLTADKKNVVVNAFLAWRVADPLQFVKAVRDHEVAQARLADVMRAVIGDTLSGSAFDALVAHPAGTRSIEDLAADVTAAARERAGGSFGVEVLAVRFKRLSFPAQNKDAVFSRMETERRAIATGLRSEGREEAERIKAEADREKAAILAEAERKAAEIRGAAEADAARIAAEAYARDPALFELVRSLEALVQIVDWETTIVLPADHELLKVLKEPPPRVEKTKAPPENGSGPGGEDGA